MAHNYLANLNAAALLDEGEGSLLGVRSRARVPPLVSFDRRCISISFIAPRLQATISHTLYMKTARSYMPLRWILIVERHMLGKRMGVMRWAEIDQFSCTDSVLRYLEFPYIRPTR